jgi:polyisoprenoid-binding protein YceI
MNVTAIESVDAARPTVWELDADHTEVEFEVKHLMISRVRGRFGGIRGRIVLDEGELTRSAVEVEIEAASIDTRQAQRDEHLRSADFFDVERFPQLRFRSTAVSSTRTGFELRGGLTIRDVTREVVLEVTEEGRGTDPWGGERIAFHARTRIDRRDFGLTWNQALETGGVLVGNEINITLEIQAVKVPVDSPGSGTV